MLSPATAQKQAYDLKGIKILILEDFPFMAELMASMLKKFNVGHIFSSCDIEEAQKTLQKQNAGTPVQTHIDLVITDLVPPHNSGLHFMNWLRNHEEDAIKYIPILFCTAHTTLPVVISGRDKGANEILVKPVAAEKLANRLLHIIDRPRSFIKAPAFFGPDRRRAKKTFNGKEKRIRDVEDVKVVNEKE